MKSKAAQWTLWAVTMAVLLWLTLSGHFDWLMVAMIVGSAVWYTVVPRTVSR
jgi:hypothetical protein